MALYEDAPPDLLAGRMDLQVILPEGDQQKINVPRSTAMMDLRVQLTTSRKLSPSAFSLQPLGPAGETLPFQPSTPVGALDVWSVRLIPKTRGNSSVPVKRAAPRPIPVAPGAPLPGAPTPLSSSGGGTTRTFIGGPGPPSFEQTFRLQVHLPRNQLFVTRASSRVLLGDVLQLACQEKNLDPTKYEIRHPANLEQRLSPEATLGECNLTEVALVPCGARQPDTPALLRQEARRREAAHRGTAPPLSAHYPYVIPHTAGTEGSVSSMSSGGRSASPAPSDGSSVDRSTSPPQPLPPQSFLPPASTKVPVVPNRPGRKRRPAPKPPGPPAKELNNNVCNKEANPAPVISHSRNSSDSSGYHEASVLSESPEGGVSCGGSGTESLPSLAPRGKTELSQSMMNLSSLPPPAVPKTAPATSNGMGKRNGHSASTSALFPADGGGKGTPGRKRLLRVWSYFKVGQRKKKAPPPPPPVAMTTPSTPSTPASIKESPSESFLKTQSLERRDMVRSKSSTLPAMSSASLTSQPTEDVPVVESPMAEKPLPPSTLPPSPRPPSADPAESPPAPSSADPPQHPPQTVRVGSSSGSQTPTPTPSEGDSCMAPGDPVDCSDTLSPAGPPAVTPRRTLLDPPAVSHVHTHPKPGVEHGTPESKPSTLPKPRPRRSVKQDQQSQDPQDPVKEAQQPMIPPQDESDNTEKQVSPTDSMYLTKSAPLFRRNWLSNSGSFGEESSRHELMPYDASLSSEHNVIHEEAEVVSNCVSNVSPDVKDGLPSTPETSSSDKKADSPFLTPNNRNLSDTSNDSVFLTPNCTKTESTFCTPEDSGTGEEDWQYRLPSPPSAFRDTRSDSPTTPNPRAVTAATPAGDPDDVCSDVTSRTGTSSHSDEEIERITGGGSVASDDSPPLSPVERPNRASPMLRSGPMSLTGAAAMLSELSQVLSEQRKDRAKRASTLEYPKTNAASESRLDNFSMSTYSRPQSAHSVVSPEVKPSLVVARRSSFNNGACSGNGVSVRRTTSHATLSGFSAGQSAGQSVTGKEAFRARMHESKTLGRATSEMNLNAGLPAPLQLDPEQATLLDEFMEWRRQQRLKKQMQAQTNQSGGAAGAAGEDIRAKVLEDDVQSLQMFQKILSHLEATEMGGSKLSPVPTMPERKEIAVEQQAVKDVSMREASPVNEVSKETTSPVSEASKETSSSPSPTPKQRPESPSEEVVLREKTDSTSSFTCGRSRKVLSGPPTIQMSTWNERPKRQVSIKLDRDYWVGVGAAGLRRTDVLPGLVEADKTQNLDEVDGGRQDSATNSRPVVDLPAAKPALEPKLISQKSDSSRLPIVRAVELKRPVSASDQPTRPLANSVVYLSASDDSSVKAVSVGGSTSNKSKKFTSVVDISRPAVHPETAATLNGNSGVRVNGVVPHANETKKNLPMPVVKPFKLNRDSVMSRQLSAPNPTPPPPPVPPTMPTLKKVVRPQSLPAKALDPRDQLLEAIRNFGGRTNLRPT